MAAAAAVAAAATDAAAAAASCVCSATRLAAPLGGTREFGGYVVPRSSLGQGPGLVPARLVPGALLRRVVSLIGGGAKGMTYFLL